MILCFPAERYRAAARILRRPPTTVTPNAESGGRIWDTINVPGQVFSA
ncbi:MAG: hypothetical protein JW929_09485 [Anaerolineales bacterium]|nr:hypothetical protein [Anaerolineales bacterium]